MEYNACKYFIGLDTKEEYCNNFDQSISKLLNNDNIAERIKFRKNLILKISDLRKMINKIVHKYDDSKDRYGIKSNMDDIVNQFRDMFLLYKNEVMNEDSIADCIAILKDSIYLANDCVKKYIKNMIIVLTVNIDNNENIQNYVITRCEEDFNSFNSFVQNYTNAFDLTDLLKIKYDQSKINQSKTH